MPKEIMRRRLPRGSSGGRRDDDIKRAYTPNQLSEIGAISLLWNECDHLIDWTIKAVLELPDNIWLEVATRFSGFDGKLAIVKLGILKWHLMPLPAQKLMNKLYDDVALYAKYRHNIIHALTYDLDTNLGLNIGRQARIDQIILSEPALNGFYDRLVLLRDELRCSEALFRLISWDVETLLQAKGVLVDPRSLRSSQEVPGLIAQFQDRQKARLLLPQLPGFPDEDEVGLLKEGKTAPPGPVGTSGPKGKKARKKK